MTDEALTSEQVEALKKEHSEALTAAQNTLMSLQNQLVAIVAEKDACIQTVNELLQANIGMKARLIAFERQTHNTLLDKDKLIESLNKQLKNPEDLSSVSVKKKK